jgi:Apea-like HEPN
MPGSGAFQLALSSDAEARIDEAISVLRLFQAGHVSTPGVLHTWDDPFQGGRLTSRSLVQRPQPKLGGYALTAPLADEFQSFWASTQASDARRDGAFEVALRRFSEAAEKFSGADRMVDLMIAAEAMFLPGGDRAEFRFKLAVRGAHWKGGDREARIRAFKLLEAAYDARSKIVHGRSLKKLKDESGPTTVEALADRTEEFLRLGLKRMIHEGVPPPGIKCRGRSPRGGDHVLRPAYLTRTLSLGLRMETKIGGPL